MSPPKIRIDEFLALLKAEGRSSPAGMHWQEFYNLLARHDQSGLSRPPPPLILAAASEPESSKHERLGAQLEWAAANNCLDFALAFLRGLPPESWNRSALAEWDRPGY